MKKIDKDKAIKERREKVMTMMTITKFIQTRDMSETQNGEVEVGVEIEVEGEVIEREVEIEAEVGIEVGEEIDLVVIEIKVEMDLGAEVEEGEEEVEVGLRVMETKIEAIAAVAVTKAIITVKITTQTDINNHLNL